MYRAPYLAADQPIAFAEEAPLDTPEIIVLPWLRAPARTALEPQAAADLADVRSVECLVTGATRFSPAAQALHRAGIVRFASGAAPLLTMTFAAAPSAAYDLRPALPVRLQA